MSERPSAEKDATADNLCRARHGRTTACHVCRGHVSEVREATNLAEDGARYDAGFAAGYAAALSKPEIDKVRAQALRDAAAAWVGGEWRAVNFNRAGRDEHPGMRQARWMRERADRIAGVTPPAESTAPRWCTVHDEPAAECWSPECLIPPAATEGGAR